MATTTPSHRQKAFQLATIMKNKDLATLLSDAINSPEGSLARDRARSVFKTFQNMARNYERQDGQGGALGQNPFSMPLGYGLAGVSQATAAQQPNYQFDLNSSGSLITNTPGAAQRGPSTPLSMGSSNGTIQPSGSANNYQGTGLSLDAKGNVLSGGAASINDILQPAAPPVTVKPGAQYQSPIGPQLPGSASSGASGAPETPGSVYYPTQQSIQQKLEANIPLMIDDILALSSTGPITIDDWYDSLSNSEKEYNRDIYNAVKNGKGATAFAMETFANRDKLAQALGQPIETIDKIWPGGGLLSDQLNSLWETTKKKYDIEQQHDNLLTMITQGVTIDTDFKSYIRGRDEYMGEIDRLIDGASEKIAYMDTSNPYVAKRMGNYMNYLTTLKGRQTMRYQDFVNQAIDYHKAKTASLKEMYDDSYNKFQEEYKAVGSQKQEFYTIATSMLKDMYTNVESRVKLANDQNTLARSAASDSLNSLTSLLGAYGTYTKNVIESTRKDYGDVTASEIEKSFGINRDENGNVTNMEIYSPWEAINKAGPFGHDPEAYADQWYQTSREYMESKAASGSFLSEYAQFIQNINSEDASKIEDPQERALAEQVQAQANGVIEYGVETGMRRYLNSALQNRDDIENMVDDLVDIEVGDPEEAASNRAKFTANYAPVLGDYASLLFDSYYRQLSGLWAGGDLGGIEMLKKDISGVKNKSTDDIVNNMTTDILTELSAQ